MRWYPRLRIVRSFGSPKQLRALPRNIWLELVIAVCLALVLAGGYAAVSHLLGSARSTRDRQWALGIADTQIQGLQTNHGLSIGLQCFDAKQTPRSATEATRPCSYDPATHRPGCDNAKRSDCVTVLVTPAGSTTADTNVTTLPLNYTVRVSWGRAGDRQQVTDLYRLVQANPAYGGDHVNTGGTTGTGGNGPIGTADGEVGGTGTTVGGTPIHKLADIPGGPSVAAQAALCKVGARCDSTTAYDLFGHFMLTTNIPSKLITGCTWTFGDDTPQLDLRVTQVGCSNGDVVDHDYSGIWQMQHLPDYPNACLAPLGSGVDSYVFLASVTVHTTQNIDITSPSPHRTEMPGCKQ